MPASEPTQSNNQAKASDSKKAQYDAYAELFELIGSTSTRRSFFSGALRVIARSFASPYAAISINFGSEQLEDDCHFGPAGPQFWEQPLQQYLSEALTDNQPRAKVLNPKRGTLKAAFLSAPIIDADNRAIGAIALVHTNLEKQDIVRWLATLACLVPFLILGGLWLRGTLRTRESSRIGHDSHPADESAG